MSPPLRSHFAIQSDANDTASFNCIKKQLYVLIENMFTITELERLIGLRRELVMLLKYSRAT